MLQSLLLSVRKHYMKGQIGKLAFRFDSNCSSAWTRDNDYWKDHRNTGVSTLGAEKKNASANNYTLAPIIYKDLNYTSSKILSITRSSQDPANIDFELCSRSKQWFYFNSTTKTPHCISDSNTHITCSDSGPLLLFGNCATYSEDTELVTIAKCPYLQV